MTELFLIRHGETTWNIRKLIQGSENPSLSELGIKQAEMLAERFASTPVDAIYASDLKRAAQTAEIIAEKKGLPVHFREGLRELCFGEWEGKPFSEVMNGYHSFLEFWSKNDCGSSVRDAESMAQCLRRSVPVLEEIVKNHEDGKVILVAHGVVNSFLLSHVLGLDIENFWKFQFGNTSVSRVVFLNGSSRVTLLNDTSHLIGEDI
jgi:broad specificity phosphatase PhoE